uniref:Uncharacterized protein n=1 Tax=Crocodylus porosus TaxID=8502 RepID=A0A7M4FUJ4_CROPO
RSMARTCCVLIRIISVKGDPKTGGREERKSIGICIGASCAPRIPSFTPIKFYQPRFQ